MADYAAGERAYEEGDFGAAYRAWLAVAIPRDDQPGNPDAQANLGHMYRSGQGVERNYAAAAVWFRRAAEQGNRFAATGLGVLYATGRGVPWDITVAGEWYAKAGDQRTIATRTKLVPEFPGQTMPPAVVRSTVADDGPSRPLIELGDVVEPDDEIEQSVHEAVPGPRVGWVRPALPAGGANPVTDAAASYVAGSVAFRPLVRKTADERVADDEAGEPTVVVARTRGVVNLPRAKPPVVSQRTARLPTATDVAPEVGEAAVAEPMLVVPAGEQTVDDTAVPAVSEPIVLVPPVETALDDTADNVAAAAVDDSAVADRPVQLASLGEGPGAADWRAADADGGRTVPTVVFQAAEAQREHEETWYLAHDLLHGRDGAADVKRAQALFAELYGVGYLGPVPKRTPRDDDVERFNKGLQAYLAGDHQEALPLWRDLAGRGHGGAQFALGNQLEAGQGTTADPYEATRWFFAAAVAGHRQAQFQVGGFFDDGELRARDAARAARWYAKAAAQGHPLAQFKLGVMHIAGDGVEVDFERAKALFESSAEQGVSLAQHNLATIFDLGLGVAVDRERAAAFYAAAATEGVASSQYRLGVMQEFAEGVPADPAAAVEHYRNAADDGLASAQYTLATLLERGEHVDADAAAAKEWYTRAAAQDHAGALTALGRFYRDGIAGPVDGRAAVGWFRRAAQMGDPEAQHGLAEAYAQGAGVPQDDGEALLWLNRAAQRGHVPAQVDLGMRYANQDGPGRDVVQALRWLQIAADGGDKAARKQVREIALRATDLEKQQAALMVQNWQPADLAPLPDAAEALRVRRLQ